ncbi:hypothetical protein HK102_000951, partial [Quaeritorhiza haematococci]
MPLEKRTGDESKNLAKYVKLVNVKTDDFDVLQRKLLEQFFYDVVGEMSYLVSDFAATKDEDKRRLRVLLSKAKYIVTVIFPTPWRPRAESRDLAAMGNEETSSSSQEPSLSEQAPLFSPRKKPVEQRVIPGSRVPGGGKLLLEARTLHAKPFPKLPPEIVAIVIENVHSSGLVSTLAACISVNKTWASLGIPLLWQHVELLSGVSAHRFFVGCLLNKRRDLEGGHIVAAPGIGLTAHLRKLNLTFIDREARGITATVIEHLQLFPNLRDLVVDRCPSYDSLTPLFAQYLPSLQSLTITGFTSQNQPYTFSWDWAIPEYPLPEHAERVRRFASRLRAVYYSCTLIHRGECAGITKMAHESLQVVRFPEYVPDDTAFAFFAQCSGALLAADITPDTLSESTLEHLATRCTGLRALAFRNAFSTEWIDLNGLAALFEIPGTQLRFLYLGGEEYTISSDSVRTITLHCHSLEHLELHGSSAYPPGDAGSAFVQVVRECGATLKYLGLYAPVSQYDVLIAWTAKCCPMLEALILCEDWNLYVEDKYARSTTADIGKNVRENTLRDLINGCKHLRHFLTPYEFLWDGLTDSALRKTMKAMDYD